MDLGPHNWDPLPVDAAAGIFRDLPAPWWIAGGWALDLLLGRATRPHQDTDVMILRRDQLAVQEHLRHQWRLFKTHQPVWPHLAPEIQLLHRSRAERAKNALDFRNVLPCLPRERARWLLDALWRQYPEGHAWMAPLVARVETPRRKVL